MRNPEEVKPDRAAVEASAPATLKFEVEVDRQGCFRFPPEILEKLGAGPGSRVRVVYENDKVMVEPDIHALRRLYIEPTSGCNLKCQTCIRNTWNEPFGSMRLELFDRLCQQIKELSYLRSVMLAGFGEPLFHPDIMTMVRKLKEAAAVSVEITTNGTLLAEEMARQLLEAGLDRLWVSFDGTSETSFDDIRQGASFRLVLKNVQKMKGLATEMNRPLAIGISFVVMRDNIDDIRNIEELIREVGADQVLMSNVLPYTEEMERKMLCLLALTCETFANLPGKPRISLPRLDINYLTKEPIYHLLKGYQNLFMINNAISAEHVTYLYGLERRIKPYFLGDLNERSLPDIWSLPEYHDFREKVDKFDFSPCHICGGCSYLEGNEEDCFGNTFPVCGGCLWAQGVIQCP
ncbi:MAG: radical SAM protein [Candidatus Saccharicenans sp.]|nr:radical SAM protein [Candidatus Saccharicenans sp.]